MNMDEKLRRQGWIDRSAKFQRVFSGAEGEYVLKELDTNMNYKYNCFDPNPYINAYKAGQRSAMVFIHTVLEQDCEQAMKMLKKISKENQ